MEDNGGRKGNKRTGSPRPESLMAGSKATDVPSMQAPRLMLNRRKEAMDQEGCWSCAFPAVAVRIAGSLYFEMEYLTHN